jgi:hypothetical protein
MAVTDPFDLDVMASGEAYVTAESGGGGGARTDASGDAIMADGLGGAGGGSALTCIMAGRELWPSPMPIPGGVAVLLPAPLDVCKAAGLPALVAVGSFAGFVQLVSAETGAAVSAALSVGMGAVTHVALQVQAHDGSPPSVRLLAVACGGQVRQWAVRLRAPAAAAPPAALLGGAALPPFVPSADVTASVAPLLVSLLADVGSGASAGTGPAPPRVTLARVGIRPDGAPTATVSSVARAAPPAPGGAAWPPAGLGGGGGLAGGRPSVTTAAFVWDREAESWTRA